MVAMWRANPRQRRPVARQACIRKTEAQYWLTSPQNMVLAPESKVQLIIMSRDFPDICTRISEGLSQYTVFLY
jgi:hypothetical protein